MSYNVYAKIRKYNDYSLVSFYYQKNKNVEKKTCPIDLEGKRYKLDKTTGDITTYCKKEILRSFKSSIDRTKVRINTFLEMNDFEWFWTLTFDKRKIDRGNDEKVFKTYKQYVKKLRLRCPTFKYMTFPERHKDGCIHLHMLVGGISKAKAGYVYSGKVLCSWARDKGGTCSEEYFEKTKSARELKETDGVKVYNLSSFLYGFSSVTKISDKARCKSYVKKYVTKSLGCTDVFKKRFYYSTNLKRPYEYKKLIASGLMVKGNVGNLEQVNSDVYYKNADMKKEYGEYNVLQVKIDNSKKDFIDFIDKERKNGTVQ